MSSSLRISLVTLFVALLATVSNAQQGGGRGAPPKNLKVLTVDELRAGAMGQAVQGLGVMCGFCHVEDRASDEKPEKLTARMMFQMVKDINSKMPADAAVKVTCWTCHRGMEMPEAPPPMPARGGGRGN